MRSIFTEEWNKPCSAVYEPALNTKFKAVFKEIKRCKGKETSLEYLLQANMDKLCSIDRYPSESHMFSYLAMMRQCIIFLIGFFLLVCGEERFCNALSVGLEWQKMAALCCIVYHNHCGRSSLSAYLSIDIFMKLTMVKCVLICRYNLSLST